MKTGDKVRVRIDTNGGWHGLVGVRGYYADRVRATGAQQATDGSSQPYVTLTYVSWTERKDCEPTKSDDAQVEMPNGKTYRIRMLDRGKVWWAILPGALEPLACRPRYDEALAAAVGSLGRDNR